MNEITLYRGTNMKDGTDFKSGNYSDVSWWSDNYDTLEHYYEGCVLQMTIKIDDSMRDDYIQDMEDLVIPVSLYTYGYAEMNCPAGAIWYSFSRKYLLTHITKIEIISLEKAEELITRQIHGL